MPTAAPYPMDPQRIDAEDARLAAYAAHLRLDPCAVCGSRPVIAQYHAIAYRADGSRWVGFEATHAAECCGRRVASTAPSVVARLWHDAQARRSKARELWAARAARRGAL